MTTSTIQKLIAVLLFSIIAAQLAHAQALSWKIQTQISVAHGTVSFQKIDAPHGDTLHVMAVGSGGDDKVVCRTTDGGATWDVPLHRVFLEPKMEDLSHPTPNVAVIVGDTMYRDTGSTIIYTHDSGDTWQQGWCDSCKFPNGARLPLWYVSMCDSVNGLLAAPRYLIARTTDGGATWRRIPDPTNGEGLFFGLQCLSPSTYMLNTGSTYRTTDSGRTWTHDLLARGTHRTNYIDSLHGWAAGYRGDSALYFLVARTTNAGRTWDTLYNTAALSWRDFDLQVITMADALHGIASGTGSGWLYTTNGTTWQEGPNLDSVLHVLNIGSVTYPHPDKAWATDGNGHILVYDRNAPAAVPIVAGVTAAASIAAWPNPVTSGEPVSISITLPRSAPGTDRPRLSLVDVRGSTIATIEQPIASSTTLRFVWFPPASLPAGVYFLRLVAGAQVATLRVPIVH